MPTLVIRLYGIVQGVGFRPFVARTAEKLGVTGTVANKGSYVEVFASGTKVQLDSFVYSLKNDTPPRAVVLNADIKEFEEKTFKNFEIIESEKEQGAIFVSPDIAICDECRKELFDKNDRRYLHPFINCTNCGPRLTILKAMPYDRERTTMSDFPMCPQCEYEYTHSETRRYDAQPVCCNDCGPQVYIVGSNITGREAITFARRSIMEGKIIAVKGIGGFHLCCNAHNEKAVQRLRTLKKRPMKPLAVMMKDIETVKRECEILEGQEEFLCGYQKPILLLEKKSEGKLCKSISPDNLSVGVMLPYAPLQMLLFDYDDEVEMTDCLVMTSGNVSGAPICRNDSDAVKEIGDFCDLILSNNRDILIRADDSVMDWFEGKPYMIRRSRGFAPLPIILSQNIVGQALGIGGELKNTFCVGKDNMLYLSSYVGDMADIRTVKALEESVQRLEELLEAQPEIVACDMHPKYNTVAFAEETSKPVLKIQHHYAHILSCMAENDYSEKCIGVSFDGTGYGTDATIWGGEFLLCDYYGFERVGHISPFMQTGGDLSAKESWRIAVSLIQKIYGENGAEVCENLGLCNDKQYRLQKTMSDNKINSVSSTSCGRLFDGVSAILGIRRASTFEGEASMTLEFAAMRYERENGNYMPTEEFQVEKAGDVFVPDTNELVKYLCNCFLTGETAEKLAYIFHYQLSRLIVSTCEKIREESKINCCALSGGVFQNKLLLRLTKTELEKQGFNVLIHRFVPSNDGGIALGQCAAALIRNNNL